MGFYHNAITVGEEEHLAWVSFPTSPETESTCRSITPTYRAPRGAGSPAETARTQNDFLLFPLPLPVRVATNGGF